MAAHEVLLLLGRKRHLLSGNDALPIALDKALGFIGVIVVRGSARLE